VRSFLGIFHGKPGMRAAAHARGERHFSEWSHDRG
jgi:hypothetical protein